MAPIRKEVEVIAAPKRIKLPASAEVPSDLPGGAALAKEIVDLQLRAISTSAKSRNIDAEDVKSLKDMASVYEMLAKIERDERKASAIADKLAAMTEDELDALEKELRKK